MARSSWDVIIVGQGLAGTTLAWCLRAAGQRVLIIDADAPGTSSKIAAGLVTPITGQRLVLTQRCDEFLSSARKFYATVEQRIGQKIFHDRVAVRLFKSDGERQNWAKRGQRPDYQTYLLDPQPTPLLDPAVADTRGGGFAMNAAQLDVAAYLKASRAYLDCETMALDWQKDVSFTADGVSAGAHKARLIISCEGFAATRNPYFSWVPFIAAKGDILTVKFDRPLPPICLHRGIWLAPTNDPRIFWTGSTYDWETLDNVPNADARAEIEGKLKDFLSVRYRVLDHRAAVRPIITQSLARIGLHPEHKQLGYFNGLGSKGSLHAPLYAQSFTAFLVNQTPLPEEADVAGLFTP